MMEYSEKTLAAMRTCFMKTGAERLRELCDEIYVICNGPGQSDDLAECSRGEALELIQGISWAAALLGDYAGNAAGALMEREAKKPAREAVK